MSSNPIIEELSKLRARGIITCDQQDQCIADFLSRTWNEYLASEEAQRNQLTLNLDEV